ncbi:hypothetical protein ABBQ38_015381 [Trebouxia sp. C0009 RCD-2024]
MRQNVHLIKAHAASLHKSKNCCIILQCTHQKRMKIVTWNVNGLRAVLNRRFGSLKSLLSYLKAGANIGCRHFALARLDVWTCRFCRRGVLTRNQAVQSRHVEAW